MRWGMNRRATMAIWRQIADDRWVDGVNIWHI